MTDVVFPVAGGSLFGSRAGKGEPALLLHGGPGLSDYTGSLAQELAPLFDVVRYQQRGLAPSLESGPYDVETNVSDALAVLDALRVDRAWLIGHSAGGLLAMHVAVAAPERVRGLIAINTLGAVPDGGLRVMIAALQTRYEAHYGRPLGEDATIQEDWPLRFSKPDKAPPWPGIRYSHVILAETLASVNDHYERKTLVRGLPLLEVPALFIHGRMDPLPPSASAETAALMRDSTLRIIEDCGHFPWIEQPGLIGRLAADMLQRLGERNSDRGRPASS